MRPSDLGRSELNESVNSLNLPLRPARHAMLTQVLLELIDYVLISCFGGDFDQAQRSAFSAFGVGAAGRGASGRVYLGCNIEFTQTDLANTIHAEGFVLANALAYGETHLTGTSPEDSKDSARYSTAACWTRNGTL